MTAHQNQHVWNGDNISLIPHRHAGLKVVASVLPVRHCVVGMKRDVVFLDAFSEKHFKREKHFSLCFFFFNVFALNKLADWHRCLNPGCLLPCFQSRVMSKTTCMLRFTRSAESTCKHGAIKQRAVGIWAIILMESRCGAFILKCSGLVAQLCVYILID